MEATSYQNQPVLATLNIALKDDESFFNPGLLGHTGYAADGYFYQAGARNTGTVASWASEQPSATRGIRTDFPATATVLLNGTSLVVFDTSGGALTPWMVFSLADALALPNTWGGETLFYTAPELCWACGRLTVLVGTGTGASASSVATLTLDFAQDEVYIDAPQAAPA